MEEFVAKTLTAVHVGNGNKLIKNFDFFIYKDEEDFNSIGIIDIGKVANIIGYEKIERLISFIDKKGEKSIYSFIKENATKGYGITDITKRRFRVFGDFQNKTELKEQLVNSNNFPIIPGSSLKGAIRTAIASYLITNNKEIVDKAIREVERTKQKEIFKFNLKDYKILESTIINKIFAGKEKGYDISNKNTMRFITVGDIEFMYETQATVLDIINYTLNGWSIKSGKSSLIETISEGCESESFRIKVNRELLSSCVSKDYIDADISYLNNIKSIFSIVNKHTQKILEEEINFWNEHPDYDDIGGQLDKYLVKLNEVLEQVRNLKDDEMIIRVGANSGWTSITGGWTSDILDEKTWSHLYHLLNKNRNVGFFPKTRKSDKYGELFGFVKITSVK